MLRPARRAARFGRPFQGVGEICRAARRLAVQPRHDGREHAVGKCSCYETARKAKPVAGMPRETVFDLQNEMVADDAKSRASKQPAGQRAVLPEMSEQHFEPLRACIAGRHVGQDSDRAIHGDRQQGVLAGEMFVERRPTDSGCFQDVVDPNVIEGHFQRQQGKCRLQCFARPARAGIELSSRRAHGSSVPGIAADGCGALSGKSAQTIATVARSRPDLPVLADRRGAYDMPSTCMHPIETWSAP